MSIEYGREVNGVTLHRDVFAEHFAEDIRTRYIVRISNECIFEGEDTKVLAKEIKLVVKRLEAIARFLEKKK